jgi:mevalonate kinase
MNYSTSAPAKIILFGEHAVVYGHPAIAVPVSSLRATATVLSNSAERGFYIHAIDLNKTLPINIDRGEIEDALELTVKLTLDTLNAPLPDTLIQIESQIPMASGLGSGAAVATALARAITFATGSEIDNETLNQLIFETEKLHHGTPSGVDNTVIVYEKPVYFIRDHPIETLHVGAPFQIVIGDTGESALTRESVGDVRKLLETRPERIKPILHQIGEIGKLARSAIETGAINDIGSLMLENHKLLHDLTVSSESLDILVEAAISAGALGAKLSGGGRGGNMIALVTPNTREKVKEALRMAGAIRVFDSQVCTTI